MDPRLLDHYNRELQFIREMGGEFAREYPKIAGRLGLEGFDCADPYVERLLEGFAFLTARVQLKLKSEFPRFTRHLLEMVYPHYLAPTPSIAVVRFEPDLDEGSLAEGLTIPRGSALRSRLGKGDRTACEYRTAHEVVLWPLELTEAEYFTHARPIAEIDLRNKHKVKAGLRLRLRLTAGATFDQIPLDRLPLFFLGPDELPVHVYEQFLANAVGVVLMPPGPGPEWHEVLGPESIRSLGFDDEDALIPHGSRSFQGYRLLQEYFAFPQRFLFAELTGLGSGVRRCKGTELEIVILFDRLDPLLQNAVGPPNFGLFCTPAANLFRKRADRIHLAEGRSQYPLIADRTRPLDFEVFAVEEVVGHGTAGEATQPFRPFYASYDRRKATNTDAYYTLQRSPHVLSEKERRVGARTSYVGSEIFLSLVDGREAPYRSDLRQLSLETMCTNRDLPLQMALGGGRSDFTLELGAPVESIRCVAGPTPPRPAYPEGETSWRLISHLGLNYLSLFDADDERGAEGVRELLRLYGENSDAGIGRHIEGVRSVTSTPVTRRLPLPGPIAFGRGMQIVVTLDEQAFEGLGAFPLGAVLERFFSRYVSLNSFTETVVKTSDRGEIARWPARIGRRHRL